MPYHDAAKPDEHFTVGLSMDKFLQLYHHLPYPFRVLVASAHGYNLRRLRYGRSTDQLLEEALEREQWTPEKWKDWQEERLAYLLHRAATKVPYYREQWSFRRRKNDRASWEYLENWPLLEKEPLRVQAPAFVAEDCDISKMVRDSTSGTTGKPVRVWLSRETVQKWYALCEARIHKWHGVSRKDRWAMIGGQLVAPFSQSRPPFWVWNSGLNQLYMSAYHLSPSYVPVYLDAMRQYRVDYLLGLASSMHALAQISLDLGLEAPVLKVAISNGEPLYPNRRKATSRTFQCPVRDTYGMVEIVCAASECKEGNMHLWPEVGIVEVFTDEGNETVQPGQTGRFICTGLLNADMPLIRYALGDRGEIAPPGRTCSCGRTLPVLQKLDGRHDDVILTRDGRRVGCVDTVFKENLPIREARIIQESLDRICVRYIPASNFSKEDEESIVNGMHERLGDVEVILDPVDFMPRHANGKAKVIESYLADAKSEE